SMPNKYFNLKRYRNYYRSRIQKPLLKKMIPDQKPDFLIVGAQKAGTSTLFNNLSQHPQLFGARTKEICYFSRTKNYERGENWYIDNLKNHRQPFKKGLLFEATPEYLSNSKAAKRIHDLFGKKKVPILDFKNLVKCKTEVLNKILVFLDLNETNWDFLKKLHGKGKNARSYKKPIQPDTKTELETFYKIH